MFLLPYIWQLQLVQIFSGRCHVVWTMLSVNCAYPLRCSRGHECLTYHVAHGKRLLKHEQCTVQMLPLEPKLRYKPCWSSVQGCKDNGHSVDLKFCICQWPVNETWRSVGSAELIIIHCIGWSLSLMFFVQFFRSFKEDMCHSHIFCRLLNSDFSEELLLAEAL